MPVRRWCRFAAIVAVIAFLIALVVALLFWRYWPVARTVCPSSSLAGDPPCTPGNADLPNNDMPNNDMPNNDMPNNDMPNNGLTAESLASNDQLLRKLTENALSEDLLAGWRDLLAKRFAPDLVQYVVSCALDPNERVKIPPFEEHAQLRTRLPCGFRGELGLCSKTYATWAAANGKPADTSWRAGAPTEECLERVSSCVLARVNAIEARVPISMRGDGRDLIAKVPVRTMFREHHGTPIQSFARCDRMCLWGDPLRRNCDWVPRHVGQCVRNKHGTPEPPRTVRLKIDATSRVRVRICKGIYGCDDVAPALGAGASTAPVRTQGHLVEFPTHYGGHMIAQRFVAPGGEVSFECPDDGPLDATGHRTGYYSVMLGTIGPASPLDPTLDAKLVGTAGPQEQYPAPEVEVFSYREGGFYGQLFPRGAATPPTGALCSRTLTGDQFACASEIWSQEAALRASRLCAGAIDPNLADPCFENPPGKCDAPAATPLCKPLVVASPTTPTVYDGCSSTRLVGPLPVTKQWERPFSVYLNHPCDLFASDDECKKHLAGNVLETIANRDIKKPPGGNNPNDPQRDPRDPPRDPQRPYGPQ